MDEEKETAEGDPHTSEEPMEVANNHCSLGVDEGCNAVAPNEEKSTADANDSVCNDAQDMVESEENEKNSQQMAPPGDSPPAAEQQCRETAPEDSTAEHETNVNGKEVEDGDIGRGAPPQENGTPESGDIAAATAESTDVAVATRGNGDIATAGSGDIAAATAGNGDIAAASESDDAAAATTGSGNFAAATAGNSDIAAATAGNSDIATATAGNGDIAVATAAAAAAGNGEVPRVVNMVPLGELEGLYTRINRNARDDDATVAGEEEVEPGEPPPPLPCNGAYAATAAATAAPAATNGGGSLYGVDDIAEELEPDHSILNKPILAGSPALEQIVNGITCGTPELRNLLLYECTIVYECCVCQGLFRALPNFIAHKRLYCHDSYRSSLVKFLEKTSESHTEFVEPRAPEEPQEEEDPWAMALSEATKFYDSVLDRQAVRWSGRKDLQVELSSIDTNPNAVFQRVKDNSIEVEPKRIRRRKALIVMPRKRRSPVDVMNNVSLKGKPVIATNEDASISPPLPLNSSAEGSLPSKEGSSTSPHPSADGGSGGGCRTESSGNIKNLHNMYDRRKLMCLICKTTYSSLKCLQTHMHGLHRRERTVYPCPICGSIFFKVWSVQRHLVNLHKLEKDEVDVMRSKIKPTLMENTVPTGRRWTSTALLRRSLGGDAVTPTGRPKGRKRKRGRGAKIGLSLLDAFQYANDEREEEEEEAAAAVAAAAAMEAEMPQYRTDSEESSDNESPALVLFRCKCCGYRFSKRKLYKEHTEVCERHALMKAENLKSEPASDDDVARDASDEEGAAVAAENGGAAFPSDDDGSGGGGGGASDAGADACNGDGMPRNFADFSAGLEALIDAAALRCLRCGEQYAKMHDVKRHAVAHLGWRRYECLVCSAKRFYRRYDLKKHLRQQHRSETQQLTEKQLERHMIDLVKDAPAVAEDEDEGEEEEEQEKAPPAATKPPPAATKPPPPPSQRASPPMTRKRKAQ